MYNTIFIVLIVIFSDIFSIFNFVPPSCSFSAPIHLPASLSSVMFPPLCPLLSHHPCALFSVLPCFSASALSFAYFPSALFSALLHFLCSCFLIYLFFPLLCSPLCHLSPLSPWPPFLCSFSLLFMSFLPFCFLPCLSIFPSALFSFFLSSFCFHSIFSHLPFS